MNKILLILICCLVSLNLFSKESTKPETFLSTYQLELKNGDKVVRAQSSTFESGLLLSKFSRTHILAQNWPAQSINSVRKRAKEVSVDPKSIFVLKQKSGAIFYFSDREYTYYYSTRGGRILISKNEKEKFDTTRIHFKNKNQYKSVANL